MNDNNCVKCAGNGVTYPAPHGRAIKCEQCNGTGETKCGLWLVGYAVLIGVIAMGATIYFA